MLSQPRRGEAGLPREARASYVVAMATRRVMDPSGIPSISVPVAMSAGPPRGHGEPGSLPVVSR